MRLEGIAAEERAQQRERQRCSVLARATAGEDSRRREAQGQKARERKTNAEEMGAWKGPRERSTTLQKAV